MTYSASTGVSASTTGTGANGSPIRVMVVDDSAVIRGIITRMLETSADVQVVASVHNGHMAVTSYPRHAIDVVVLDIEMPVMDGMTALQELLKLDPDVQVIMASTLTRHNAEISLKAMRLGAADYIPKPSSVSEMGAAGDFQRDLLLKVRALGNVRKRRKGETVLSRTTTENAPSAKAASATKTETVKISLRPETRHPVQALVIGSSTGGPQALFQVLGGLAPDLKVPVFITQHMPPTFTAILADHITRISQRPCLEGQEGMLIENGKIYLAPGGLHMTIENGQDREKRIKLSDAPPENFCRPAVDVMLRSLIHVYGRHMLMVMLTGMGQDGLKASQQLVEHGGMIIAQDEETSVVWGMPGAVAQAGICSAILPLPEMAGYINNFLRKWSK